MALRFAKLASNLHSHPKIRRAGRDGKDVFIFLLCANAELDRSGRLAISYADPWYLADQLMITEAEASAGLSRAVTVGLLRVESQHIVICGWDDEWAKAPLTEAERQALKRERDKATTDKPKRKPRSSRDVTKLVVTESDSHACHASEKSREEEIRAEEKREEIASPPAPPAPRGTREPSGPHQQAIAEFDAYFARTHNGERPSWKGKGVKLMGDLVKQHGAMTVVTRIAELEQRPPPWPPTPWDIGTFSQHFDKLAPKSAGARVTGRSEPLQPHEYAAGDVAL